MTEHTANSINTRNEERTVEQSVKKMRRHHITDEELMAEMKKREAFKKKGGEVDGM